MRSHILDTSAIHTLCFARPPEKWRLVWDGVRSGRARLVLLEPIVSEMASRLARQYGRERVESTVRFLKGLGRTDIYNPDDPAALEAGFLHGLQRHDLSLVDATIIVAAIRNRAMLVTHDGSMRDVAEGLGVRVSWLPLAKREGMPSSAQ